MGTAVRPIKTSPGSWDAFADVDVFVDEVLAELEAMARDGARPMRSGPKPPLAGAALRKAVMAIWCVCFCRMQWRAIGQLCAIPFGTLYGLFARWTRLGLWRRLLDRLRRTWRRACGDSPEPSAVVIDSRSCRSAPSCFDRGIDGGKKIRGVKIHVAVDKYGMPLAIDVAPANRHDTKGIVPVLHTLAEGGFQGAALGDLGYRGERLANVGEALGITVEAIPSSGYSTGCAGGTLASLARGRTVRPGRHLLGG
jgi:transposase